MIIEARPSGKFVQFLGSASDSLLLDLPVQPLCAAEMARAHALFERFGVTLEQMSPDVATFNLDWIGIVTTRLRWRS